MPAIIFDVLKCYWLNIIGMSRWHIGILQIKYKYLCNMRLQEIKSGINLNLK